MRTITQRLPLFIVVCLLSVAAATTSMAQGKPARAQGSPLNMLQRALSQAGADPLTAAQQTALTDLITAFRTAQAAKGPDTALQTARQNLDNYILTGDLANANKAATAIGTEMGVNTGTVLQAQAQFDISALKVLTANQISKFQQQSGTTGLLRVIRSLTGRMGMGPGGGMGGPMSPQRN